MPKVVLLIVASQGYQPIEYGHTRKALEDAGIKVIVASNKKGTAHAKPCNDSNCNKTTAEKNTHYETASVNVTIDAVNPDDYDGIFIIGGPGALDCLDNSTTYSIMQKIAARNKPFGAICISPRILAHAGLLKDKKATCWNGNRQVEELFKKHEISYVNQPVVIDGTIITANGPQAATDFGKTIVSLIKERG